MGKIKTLNTLDSLLEYGKEICAKDIQEDISMTNWEDLFSNPRMRVCDFAQKQLIGLNDYDLALSREIAAMQELLNQVPEGPGKQAALIIFEHYRSCFDEVITDKIANRAYEMLRPISQPRFQLFPGSYKDDENVSADPNVIIPKKTFATFLQTADELAARLDRNNERLMVYESFIECFFSNRALYAMREGVDYGVFGPECEEELLAELNEKLPHTPEYEPYLQRDNYVNLPLLERNLTHANLVMNPNILTDITANNYSSKIHKEAPSVLDLEWGASTFDSMMDSIYCYTDRKQFRRQGRDYVDTVFLEGKRATEVFPYDGHIDFNPNDYLRRLKAEITAYALEGKGRLDICPYQPGGDIHDLADPIPVHVQVNLKEKNSIWRKFLGFFGVTQNPISKKAEKVSLDRLVGEETKTNQIRETVQREKAYFHMKEAIEAQDRTMLSNDLAFFGWTLGDKKPEVMTNRATDQLYQIIPAMLQLDFPRELLPQLGLTSTIYHPLETVGRQVSRATMINLYALTQGMTLDEVLSPDPALNDRKEAIGRSFMETFKVLGTEEFYEKNGKDADYVQYFKTKHQELFQLYERFHEVLDQQPADCFQQTDPEALAQNYSRLHFLSSASQDICQTPSKRLVAVDPEKLDRLETEHRGLGEISHYIKYCNYIASSDYLQPDYISDLGRSHLQNACMSRANMDRFKESCHGIETALEVTQIINEAWVEDTTRIKFAYAVNPNDPKFYEEQIHYARTGQNPVHFKNPETGEFTVARAAKIQELQQENDYVMNWKDFEEIPELNQLHLSRQSENQAKLQREQQPARKLR